MKTKDFYFGTFVANEEQIEFGMSSMVCLVEKTFWEKNKCMDDSLCSRKLNEDIKIALDKASVYTKAEAMEGVWALKEEKITKKKLIKKMCDQGFTYLPELDLDMDF